MSGLSLREVDTLAAIESEIEQDRDEFVTRNAARFTRIRDERLYRDSHGAFEDYCQERWGLTRQHVNRMIRAAEVVGVLEPTGSTPNEAQARELAPLLDEPDRLRETWQQVNEETGGKPTAAAIRNVVRPMAYPTRPAPVPPGQTKVTTSTETYIDTDTGEVLSPSDRYPELAHYADQPDKAARLADALDGYSGSELEGRRHALASRIAAERDGRMPSAPAVPVHVWNAEQIFAGTAELLAAIRRHGGAEQVAAAAADSDALLAQTWRDQYLDLAKTADVLAQACATKLRSVR